MALKKETPELKGSHQESDPESLPPIAEDEFEELDEGVESAVMEDTNGFSDMALIDEVGDPDINVLAQEEDLIDEGMIDLKNPEVAAELSEDPVRLYLREIGQVKLLDSDSEFRLATMIEAGRLVAVSER